MRGRSPAAAAATSVLLLLLLQLSVAASEPRNSSLLQTYGLQANKPRNTTGFKTKLLAPGVCPSMDIRSSAENLAKLRGCRVVEGILSIVLIEHTQHAINISFPELTEVTGYILMYRVKGIRSLGDLFPNLSVVRGLQLFRDFSIVIFDNEYIENLGLKSLTMIEKGAVRIQNNDKLCYTDTIDWKRIMAEGTENNVISGNYDTRLCGLCPHAQTRLSDHTQADQCPTDANHKLLCWDDKNCQKVCPSKCEDRPCTKDLECCHPSCAGGCNGTGPDDCFACKHFSFQPEKAPRKCLDQCPPGTYELYKRCVSEQDCRELPVSSDQKYAESTGIKAYKIVNNKQCVYICPAGYTEAGDVKNATCEPCQPTGCVKECVGDKIDTMAAAEKFRGCTHVKGALHIALRAGKSNTVAKLEETLGEIREITGCLKVARSNPLVSLMFLKNLRRIHDVHTAETCKGQALHIFNNPNLELLFDWKSHHPIEITSGKIYIHFNAKLCDVQIEPLHKNRYKDIDISDNGDQATCESLPLNLRLDTSAETAVILSWNMFCLEDTRQMYGYSIYYLETEQNVTLYGQRDACSDTWNVIDLTTDEVSNKSRAVPDILKVRSTSSAGGHSAPLPCNNLQPVFHPLTQLNPYTRYAAYVKAVITSQDRKGAQSNILYFRTLPRQSSPPTNPTVEVDSPHAATIKWSPPLYPNGTITTYQVQIQKKYFNEQYIKNSNPNFCQNPNLLAINMPYVAYKKEEEEEEEEIKGMRELANEVNKDGTCECEKKREKKFTTQIDEEMQENIQFENSLQNMVYVKTNRTFRFIPPTNITASLRSKRSIRTEDGHKFLVETNDVRFIPSPLDPQADCLNSTDEGYLQTQCYSLSGDTTRLVVDNMRHYTWYVVSIWACRNRVDNESLNTYKEIGCSKEVNIRFRTHELVNGDAVSSLQASIIKSNKTTPEVNLTWLPPVNPNGFVLGYSVYYARIEENTQKEEGGFLQCKDEKRVCSSYGNTSEFRSCAFVMSQLQQAGNYSLRVTPITAKGAGNTSEVYVFIPERTPETSYDWIWAVIGGCVIILLVLAGGIWYVKRGLLSPSEAHKLFASVNPEYVSTVYVPDEWEVPRTSVEFIRELGQGSFGMVYEGLAKNIEKGKPETRCAVKTVNEHATDRERVEFLNEASVMKAFDTFHVVRLLGVVSHGQPTLVIMELMELGDLKTYLRSHRPDADGSIPKKDNNSSPPTLKNILQMAIEIADGMAYLSAKKFVHRDLAARNCMVAGDLTVKVGDFGMTRDIYETDYYRKGTKGLLPVRWMSPESLKDGVFSSNSDIWSFGVVLWEMATLAMQPYQGLSNEQVVRYVVEGGVMERPEHCPDRLYELMRACWSHRASSRPSFLQLVAQLAPTAQPHFRHRSFFHSTRGQETYAAQYTTRAEEESSGCGVEVGALGSGSGGNLFGVSGRLASWVRELSSLRARSLDAAAEPLRPHHHHIHLKGPNGVVRDAEEAASTGC